MVELASRTRTLQPARAKVIAAARPLGPEPIITASCSPLTNHAVEDYSGFYNEITTRADSQNLQIGSPSFQKDTRFAWLCSPGIVGPAPARAPNARAFRSCRRGTLRRRIAHSFLRGMKQPHTVELPPEKFHMRTSFRT